MEIALERIYGHRLALPQVGAALLFAQEAPPALLLVPEAVSYTHLTLPTTPYV